MVDFTKKTKRNEITIQGKKLSIPAPFEEGMTLTGPQAGVLNQTLAENTRNNLAKSFKDTDKTDDALQGEIDSYVSEYEFGVRRSGGRTLDPVEAKAREIAVGKIKERLKANGFKVSDVSSEKMNELVKTALEKNPQITETAKTLVAQQQSALGDMEIDVSDVT